MAAGDQFTLLKPEARVPKDQPTGAEDLLRFYNLKQQKAAIESLKPFDYLGNAPGDTRLYRGRTADEAEDLGISGLAGIFPTTNRPPMTQLSDQVLATAFRFSGPAERLPEESKGVLAESLFPRDPATFTSPASPLEEHSSGSKLKKDKKDKKEKKEKKDKKEKDKKDKDKKDKKDKKDRKDKRDRDKDPRAEDREEDEPLRKRIRPGESSI
mmetsp:Transcript_37602/g.106216  ORF Transcript_37602/g.106216 Transcript_37602/m.106216 type:complete len:212 (-) Transcript_37602:251-886(-)